MATANGASGRARAELLPALVLAALAVFLTIVYLQPDSRPPKQPSPRPQELPHPTFSPSSPRIVTTAPPGKGFSGGGGGGTGVVACGGSANGACPKDFNIGGSVGGLYPGKTAQLTLTISNPNHQDIRVTEITVAVTGTDAPSCATSYLRTTNYEGPPIVVPGEGTNTVSVPVTMSRAAPDACQGVTFTLTYGGKAGKA